MLFVQKPTVLTTLADMVPPKYDEAARRFDFFAPQSFFVRPMAGFVLNLRLAPIFQENERYHFFVELDFDFIYTTGLILSGHNFNLANTNEHFQIILYNPKPVAQAQTAFTEMFGDRNQVNVKDGVKLGSFRYFKI